MASNKTEFPSLTKKQQEQLMDAHLLNRPAKDETLIKLKFVDKQGRVTQLGIQQCHTIASIKHGHAWDS